MSANRTISIGATGRTRVGEDVPMDLGTGFVVGLDNGGTMNNATVLDGSGTFLVDRLVEVPSRVKEGPAVAIEALVEAMNTVLAVTGVPLSRVRGVGLDTPGPASATGVITAKGSTNFSEPAWRGYDFRGALADRLHCRWSTTTTATRPRSTPTSRGTGSARPRTRRCRRSSAPAWAAA